MNKKTKPHQATTKSHFNVLYDEEHEQIGKKITQLRKIVRKWDETHDSQQEIPKTDQAMMKQYLRKIAIYTSSTRFNEFNQNQKIHDQMIQGLENLDDAYINFKLFQQAKWKLVISQETAEQVIQIIQGEQNLKKFFTKISLYLHGFIPINNSSYSNENYLNQVYSIFEGKCRFYTEINAEYSVLLSIGIQKIPKLEFLTNKFLFMNYSPFVQVLHIFGKEPVQKEIKQLVKRQAQLYANNPSKNIIQQVLEYDNVAMQKLGKKVQFFKYQKQKQQEQDIIVKKEPLIYKQKTFEEQQYEQYLFKLKSYEQFKQSQEKKQAYKEQQDEEKRLIKLAERQKLKQFFSFTSSRQLIDFYNQIPDKKFKLHQDQENIVTSDGNIIVIGRSGTGKTLCALLRLFVIQFFFKARQALEQSKIKRKIQASDIDLVIGLKNVFLTASPYLIKQIKKQYDELIQHMKAILMEKKMLRDQKKEQNGELSNQQQNDLMENKDLFEDQLENLELDDFIQKFQEKIQRMKNLNQLNEKDFPGFFSIKNFITLIDGTLQNPMFYKKQQHLQHLNPQIIQKEKESPRKNKIISEDQQINQNQQIWSQLDFLQENIQKPKQKKNENQKIQIQEDQNVGWIEEDRQTVDHQYKNAAKIKQNPLIQVTYQIFAQQFWPLVPKTYFKTEKQLAPANIWSQIYSVIKGSYSSHLSHTKYLSKTQYLKANKKQIDEAIQYKKIVYQIFEYYQDWKQKTHHYDFMELVNHILSDIYIYGYQGPLINYLFIDQVQDLPPATMYLISKIVTNGIFYCGDSAQTIAKGVNFKFRDIPQMFHNQFQLQKINLPSPNEYQLTMNFRSHNEILQLGHSIIQIIQKLFERSIDHLDSECSYFRGPIPMILRQNDQGKLLDILAKQLKTTENIDPDYLFQYQKNAPDSKIYRLGPQQIVLVRNKQEKQKLPYRLRQGVVLTFQDVKGLQYDDVVLVNFFSSFKYKQKWRLLNCLDVQPKYVTQQEYKQIMKQNIQIKGHNLERDESIKSSHDWDVKPKMEIINGKKYYKIPSINYCKDIRGQNVKDYFQLLTQLKILYTAITRARKTFIIYQNDIPKQLERIWLKMKAIRYITQQNYPEIQKQIHQYRRIHQNQSFKNQEKAWMKEGFKWYMRKNYEQAIRCFRNINDLKTVKRIQAQMKANQAGVQMRRIRYQLTNPDNLPKQQFRIKKNMLQAKKKPINQIFNQAGKKFEDIGKVKKAGMCYYSGQNYKQAYQCFKSVHFLKGSAQCCQILGLYQQAGQYYEQLKKFEKMLQCFQKTGNVRKIFQKLIKHLKQFTKSQTTCIKYGKYLLQYRVKQYLQSNQNLDVLWKQKDKALYQSPSSKKIEKNTSRYFLFQSIKHVQKLIEIKVRLQINEKKMNALQQKTKPLKQQEKQISRQFQLIKPYRSLKEGQIFYQLWQQQKNYDRIKPFSEACVQYRIRDDDAKALALTYQEFVQDVKRIYNEKDKIKEQIQILQSQNLNMTKQFGSKRQIEESMVKLRFIYQKNLYDGYEKQQQFNVKKIDTKKIFQTQKKSIQDQVKKDFQNFAESELQQDFQISSFIDQSFDSQYDIKSVNQDWNRSFSISLMNQNTEITKGIIFNFSINRQAVGDLIFKSKQLVSKMKNYIQCPLKPPYSDQHHLIIDAKMQSAICKNYPQFEQIITFLRRIERIGEDYLAIFTCQYYQLPQLAKKFVISKLVRANKLFTKSKRFEQAPFLEKQKDKVQQTQISNFLGSLSSAYLKNECFRTLSSKQTIIDSIVQSLLMQGFYKTALQYMDSKKDDRIQLSYVFMDYKLLYQSVLNKLMNRNKTTFEGNYLFLSQKKYKDYAKMINCSSTQQIFFLYDSIQQKPFLSQTDWNQSVNIPKQKVGWISSEVQKVMRHQQYIIEQIKKQITAKRQFLNMKLPQIHNGNIINRQQLLEQNKQEIQNTEGQAQALNGMILQLMKDNTKIDQNNIILKQQIKRNNSKLQEDQKKIQKLQGVNKLLKSVSIALQLQLNTQFHQINAIKQYICSNNLNLQFLNEKVESSWIEIVPDIKINFTLNDQIQRLQVNAFKIQQQIYKVQNKIQQDIKQVKLNTNGIQQYRRDITNLSHKSSLIKKQRLKIQNMPQAHKQQKQAIKFQIDQRQKQLKQIQNKLNTLQNQTRKQYYQREEHKIIDSNKQNYRLKIIKRIKNCDQLPPDYKKGYFEIFLKLRQQTISNRSQTFDFKRPLQQVIANCDKDFNNLDVFQQCQIIVLYLSIICYPEKTNIFQFLENQSYTEVERQRDVIRQNIRNLYSQINHIIYLKDAKQGGYFMLNQSREIFAYQSEIKDLEYKFNNIRKNSVSTTYTKLRNMITKIFKMTQNIKSQADLNFIQLMLGFFQCRIVKNCPSLWFIDRQYVIVKSNSILVKTILSKKLNDLFCYYFDDSKQYVILKFKNAYLTMKDVLRSKHINFLQNMKFSEEHADYKEKKKKYILADITTLGKQKSDPSGLDLQISCNPDKKQLIKQNYRIFNKNFIQSDISEHKEKILKYYYANGFKTPETFHFLQYQLKVLDETYKILQQCKEFSNLMIQDLKAKMKNLQYQFEKWKNFIHQQNQITGFSCQDQQIDDDEEGTQNKVK